jgi:hypothetical protein
MVNGIIGKPADFFEVNHNMRVRFRLNDSDDEARRRNEGAALHMFTDAVLEAAPDDALPYLVAVSADAAIMVDVQCNCQVGFGYSLRTGDTDLATALYAVGKPDENGNRTSTVRCCQKDKQLITVQRMKNKIADLQDVKTLKSQQFCDIKAWEVQQFLDPITSMVYNARNPRPSSPPQPTHTPRSAVAFQAHAASTDQVGAASADRMEAAAPAQLRYGVIWPEGTSNQSFETITVQKEADRNNALLGKLNVRFVVLDRNQNIPRSF